MELIYTMTVRQSDTGLVRTEEVCIDSIVTTSPDKAFFGWVIRNHPNFGAGWSLVRFGQKGQGQTAVREATPQFTEPADMTRTELPPVLPTRRRRRRKAAVSL